MHGEQEYEWRRPVHVGDELTATPRIAEISGRGPLSNTKRTKEQELAAVLLVLLAPLLKDSPYDGQYLAAMADTYAQAGDDQGLRQFYLDKIALFRNAPFSGDERKIRITTLRRGLIPAHSNEGLRRRG